MDNNNEILNPIVILKPTEVYNNYLFELNKKNNEIIIKIQNSNTSKLYEGIISENNISIKPFSKFNLMLTRALSFENNYTITFNETQTTIIVCILFNNHVIDIEETFTLNEVYISELEKQKYKIISLENKFKNENKELLEKIELLENKNKELHEGINELIEKKQVNDTKQEVFNNMVKHLYWNCTGGNFNIPHKKNIKNKLDLEMLPSCDTEIEINFSFFCGNTHVIKNVEEIINQDIIYNNIKKINFLFSNLINNNWGGYTDLMKTLYQNKELYYATLSKIINIIKKHFPNSKVECSGSPYYFEHIEYFLFISKTADNQKAIYMLK